MCPMRFAQKSDVPEKQRKRVIVQVQRSIYALCGAHTPKFGTAPPHGMGMR